LLTTTPDISRSFWMLRVPELFSVGWLPPVIAVGPVHRIVPALSSVQPKMPSDPPAGVPIVSVAPGEMAVVPVPFMLPPAHSIDVPIVSVPVPSRLWLDISNRSALALPVTTSRPPRSRSGPGPVMLAPSSSFKRLTVSSAVPGCVRMAPLTAPVVKDSSRNVPVRMSSVPGSSNPVPPPDM
jgi:hypothetical protein